MKYKFTFFLLFLICFSSIAGATPSDELEFKKQLELIEDDVSLSPNEKLSKVDSLYLLADRKDWRHSRIRALVTKIETLLIVEQLQEAQRLITETLPLTNAPHLLESRLRLLTSQMYLNDIQGNNNNQLILDILSQVDDLDSIKTMGGIYSQIGSSYSANARFLKAAEMQNKARSLFETIDYQLGLSNTLNALANIYAALGDREKAIDYYKETLAFMRELGDVHNENIVLYNLARVYLDQKKYELAEATYAKSLALTEKSNDLAGAAWAKMAIADLYLTKKDFEKSLLYYDQALPFFKENQDTRNIVNGEMYRTIALVELGQIDDARQNLLTIKPLVDEFENEDIKLTFKFVESKLEAGAGNYKRAYELYREASIKLDELRSQNDAQNEKLQEQLAQYDIEKTENDNRILQQENELQQLRIEQEQKEKTIWRLAMAFTVLVLIVIGYLLQRILANRNHFQQMALRDHLTDAPNRRAILQFAESQFQNARRNQLPLAIAIIDLDFFKRINDQFGHEVGDEVLKSFATALSASVRQQDRFGRYGGEEWLLVLTNTSAADINIVFKRINETLKSIDIPNLPSDYEVTFSMGVAEVSGQDVNLNMMIKRADDELYKAKENGRNQFKVSSTA